MDLELDHVVIHVNDWDASNKFYGHVLGAAVLDNPEGQDNPLGAWAYRVGGQQINVHGPWPGRSIPCCEPPLNEVGRADLAFRITGSSAEAEEWLRSHGVEVTDGPMRRFGHGGWGMSVYCRDPSGNGIELISYP